MNFKIPKSQAALLVIDMQNGFVHPDSGMGKSVWGTKAQQAIVPSIVSLVEHFRKECVPVIWSQQEHFPGDKTRETRLIRPHSSKQGFLPCLRGTWEIDLYPPIREAMRPADHLVQKHRASVFYNTNLEMKLRMLGTRFLFITGCNTEFCVESTVREAYARDLEILVVKDCVAGIDPALHENSLKVFQSYFGEVISLEDAKTVLAP